MNDEFVKLWFEWIEFLKVFRADMFGTFMSKLNGFDYVLGVEPVYGSIFLEFEPITFV
jgi:hypothetical protein